MSKAANSTQRFLKRFPPLILNSPEPRHASTNSANKKSDLKKAVSEAERIVGYSTSFLSLRWLLSDEIANVVSDLRKLSGSNHPLLHTAKSLLDNKGNSSQAWGVIILLVSKAAAAGHDSNDIEERRAGGVLLSQRALAEITEMIRTSHLLHKGFVNINPESSADATGIKEMIFGNKIALLSGDSLIAHAFSELAHLRNQDLSELMSSAVRDIKEEEFVGSRDDQNNPLPSPPGPPGSALDDWTLRRVLSDGSLMGKSCQGALLLGKHSNELQQEGFKFGKHLALGWQASLDLHPFLPGSHYVPGAPFNLTSAPVLLHLERDPSIYPLIKMGRRSVLNVDYRQLHNAIKSGTAIEETKVLQRTHSESAGKILCSAFENSDARNALSKIIAAMEDLRPRDGMAFQSYF